MHRQHAQGAPAAVRSADLFALLASDEPHAAGSGGRADPGASADPGAKPCRPARAADGAAELLLAPAGAYADAAVAPGGACRWQYVLAGRAVRHL